MPTLLREAWPELRANGSFALVRSRMRTQVGKILTLFASQDSARDKYSKSKLFFVDSQPQTGNILPLVINYREVSVFGER